MTGEAAGLDGWGQARKTPSTTWAASQAFAGGFWKGKDNRAVELMVKSANWKQGLLALFPALLPPKVRPSHMPSYLLYI